MSNAITTACRPLAMSPAQKSVLMALADFAHDDGKDWHPITDLMEWTCLCKTAVIEALRWLEAQRLILVVRPGTGQRNTTYIQLDRIRELAPSKPDAETSPPSAPVRETHQSVSRTQPVRLPDPTGPFGEQSGTPGGHKALEASRSKEEAKKARAKTRIPDEPCPDDVDAQVWRDWLALRRQKKAAVTQTAINAARAEAAKAGLTLEAFLKVWCLRGSAGLQADWLKANERQPAKRSFATTDYNEGLDADGRIIN